MSTWSVGLGGEGTEFERWAAGTLTTEIVADWPDPSAWDGIRQLAFDKGDRLEVTLGCGRSMLARVKSVTEESPGVFDVVLEEVLDDTPIEDA